jgi:hypothetical protein
LAGQSQEHAESQRTPKKSRSSELTALPRDPIFPVNRPRMYRTWLPRGRISKYWLAHEMGHLVTNSSKEQDAEKAAHEFRKRLKDRSSPVAASSSNAPKRNLAGAGDGRLSRQEQIQCDSRHRRLIPATNLCARAPAFSFHHKESER